MKLRLSSGRPSSIAPHDCDPWCGHRLRCDSALERVSEARPLSADFLVQQSRRCFEPGRDGRTVDASGDMPSYAEFADGYFLTRAGLASAWDQYAPDREVCRHPTASPLLATADHLAGLPPALGSPV